MLQLKYFQAKLEVVSPIIESENPIKYTSFLIISLSLNNWTGYGEMAINDLDADNIISNKITLLQAKKNMIERFALMDPYRFWHFLHHLLPKEEHLIAALDCAGWDLFAQMRNQLLFQTLGLKWENLPNLTHTISYSSIQEIIEDIKVHPFPLYKLNINNINKWYLFSEIIKETNINIHVITYDNFSLSDQDSFLNKKIDLYILAFCKPLNEQELDNFKKLKLSSSIPIYVEAIFTETDIKKYKNAFDGIVIQISKLGGISPAIKIIQEAKSLGLKIYLNTTIEGVIGAAAIAHLLPLADYACIDSYMKYKEDIAAGLSLKNQNQVFFKIKTGLGIQFIK